MKKKAKNKKKIHFCFFRKKKDFQFLSSLNTLNLNFHTRYESFSIP